jgi:tRNA threonylcarbamoyladenosine biosynthesis protein TsaB
MVTLALECATNTVGLALLDEDNVRAEIYLDAARHHSEVLLPALDQLLRLSGLSLERVDLIACTIGPGSFTGLRIGVSTVKGLALALDKPVVGVSTLEALAMNALPSTIAICPMLDARKDHIYGGLFGMGPNARPEALRPERDTDVTTFLMELDQDEFVFVGDGAIRHEELIRETMKNRATFCRGSQCSLKAPAVGLIGLDRYRTGRILDIATFAPLYLRPSEAETKVGSAIPPRH